MTKTDLLQHTKFSTYLLVICAIDDFKNYAGDVWFGFCHNFFKNYLQDITIVLKDAPRDSLQSALKIRL
jgi:hypothetical protein